MFYKKPGCATNARQIRALKAEGHDLVVRDILKEPSQADELRSFFHDISVGSWFDRGAPHIKLGQINPVFIDAASALALMLGDPFLILRPSIDVDGARCAGLDRESALSLLGRETQDHLQRCLHEPSSTRARSGEKL
ncbi:arsenate reductase family protein [Bradyrhizobium nanningense]|uniref:arsenate reductase family protein n=1 Tax=Bradyrhizobium nanningense TaxID=1325118 RepID=UPI0024BF7C77|nr:arsenate reductase family protein [Bradyrhizobium nanningense]